MQKERFPTQRKNKLLLHGDGLFQVVECINDNAYKLDLPGEYNVSAIFNVSDLHPFLTEVEHDLRVNPSQEEGNGVENQERPSIYMDKIPVPLGPITCTRAKRLLEELQGLVQVIQEHGTNQTSVEGLDLSKWKLVNLVRVKEELD